MTDRGKVIEAMQKALPIILLAAIVASSPAQSADVAQSYIGKPATALQLESDGSLAEDDLYSDLTSIVVDGSDGTITMQHKDGAAAKWDWTVEQRASRLSDLVLSNPLAKRGDSFLRVKPYTKPAQVVMSLSEGAVIAGTCQPL